MTCSEVADRILALTGTKLGVTVTPVAGATRYYQMTFSNLKTKKQFSSYLDLNKSQTAIDNAIAAIAANMLTALK